MFPIFENEVVKARREDLLREAEKERLINIAQAGQPTLIDMIKIIIGELLTTTGGRLQNKIQTNSIPEQSVIEN